MPLTISGIIPVTLNDLNDVLISGPLAGQYLRYSGTIWQNSYLNSDVFNYLNTSLTSTNGVTLDFSIPNNIKIGLASVNPTAGTFGSSSQIPVFTVDSQGRITGITEVSNGGAPSAQNQYNTGYGYNSLTHLATPDPINLIAVRNTAFGPNTLSANTTGFNNTAVGYEALTSVVSGDGNAAFGVSALKYNTANYNLAIGNFTLSSTTTGGFNSAIGNSALFWNTTGACNVAVGALTMQYNQTGSYNTSVGYLSLNNNTTGESNTAVGSNALLNNTVGNNNTAIGQNSLQNNTTGVSNIAVGIGALNAVTSGSNNVALGQLALSSSIIDWQNTAIGVNAMALLVGGSNNTFIGFGSGATLTAGASNVIIGGATAYPGASTNNNIILSDGDGNLGLWIDNAHQSTFYGNVSIPGNLSIAGTTLLGGNPTTALEAATKQYVDNIAAGVNVHASCETATDVALAATYANGTSGVGATLTSTINGTIGAVGGYASLIVGSRILIKDQSSSPSNGIYLVTDLGSPSTPWILTRALDFDGSPTFEISAGDLTYISEGVYAGTQWVETNVGTGMPGDYIIVGTDPINFTQFSGPSTYVAGPGIDISTTTISNTGVTSLIAGSNVSISGSTGDVTISTTGTVPTSTTATNLAGGAVGSIPYQTSSGATAMLAVGSGVLVGGITPTYSTSPTLIGTNFSGTASALSIGGNAATVTTNANLSGIVTSVGNATSIADGAIANAKLANSSVTIGTTSISLGTSTLTLSGLTSVSATTFTGSGSGLTSIPNSALVGNGSFALGSTAISLGSTITNVSGLTSVSATTFSGALTGNASTASGSSGNIFLTAGTGAVGTENDIGAQCNGYNAAYLYNNSTSWGLYSVTGGSIIYWNRGSSVVTIGSNLTVSGSVTATSLNATSTKRVKKAIKNLSNKYLSRFSDLKPREYDRKDYVAHEFGFIAEEMALVYPEIVGIDNTGVPSGIDYGKLSTILTAKIQEQQKTIDKLQNQMLIVMGMLKDLRK